MPLQSDKVVKDHQEENVSKDGKNSEPGASRNGNFMNYYQFHSAEKRVKQLPRAVLLTPRRKYVALDVGCNAGDLTLELQKFLSENLPECEVSILGIDLDPILIERAREKNDRPESVTFECLDFFSDERESFISRYLDEHQTLRFDLTFCFSITMWIHLNKGDKGLEKFLIDVCSHSESVLIEPQPWKCYRNASRRLRRAGLGDFPLLNNLQLRGDTQMHIERILKEKCKFHKVETSEENDWQRRLIIFERDQEIR